MNKVYCLVFVLFAYAPSALADCALQELGWVVEDMSYTELGYFSEYIAYPDVWVEDNKQYVSFSIDTDDDPDDVCETVRAYMKSSVGSADCSPSTDGGLVTITYKGDYDSTLVKPSGLQALVRVIRDFVDPSLATRKCKQYTYESITGWSYVSVNITLNKADGNDYQTASDAVYAYLSSLTALEKDLGNRTTYYPTATGNFAFLEIWNSK